MENVPLTLEEIDAALLGLPGYKAKSLGRHFKPDEGPEKILVFKVRYEPGEIIMPKGGYSDYAAVHLQGLIRVSDIEPPLPPMPACWNKPGPLWRWLMKTRLRPFLSWLRPGTSAERALAVPTSETLTLAKQAPGGRVLSAWKDDTRQARRDVQERFLGITSVLWRRPRSVTLTADNDGDEPCEMLLIKRRALNDLLFTMDPATKKQTAPLPLYKATVAEFLSLVLPSVVATNRLFRSPVYVEDVKDWNALLAGLKRPATSGAERVNRLLAADARAWIMGLGDAALNAIDQFRVVSELNKVLQSPDFYTSQAWPEVPEEEYALIERDPRKLAANERSRLNRLLLERAFPRVFRSIRNDCPSTPGDFAKFGAALLRELGTGIMPLRPVEGDVIFKEGDAADALYLILNGRFRVTKAGGGAGRIILNHLEEDGYFGEACVDENAKPRGAQVEALTAGTLLPLSQTALLKVMEEFPDFKTRLQRERERHARRDAQRAAGQQIPPAVPPPAVASRLMRATNLLVIDMHRCTRCDQCVQACTAAHDDRPRFHRANPELTFGKWEVAAACVHCVDAPCLEECPVGAITLLDRGAVHIHRTRCIGCEKCSIVCPFHVIDMYPLTSPVDGQSLPRDPKTGELKKPNIATKCDLCLTPERDPPCVVACPYGAAERGKPEDFFPGLRNWGAFSDPD